MKELYFVVNPQGYVQHEGTEASCQLYINNAGYLFGVSGLKVIPAIQYKHGV